ncbi:MAG: hypothetical protein WAV38_15505 [Xanthobacteraceae bacterium]
MSERAQLSRSAMAKAVRWKSPGGANGKISEQRKDLWHGINNFVMERGGAIVTPMYVFPARIEVEPDSKLPERLRALGYDPIFCEQTTRIGGATPTHRRGRTQPGSGYAFHAVDVYELTLPR